MVPSCNSPVLLFRWSSTKVHELGLSLCVKHSVIFGWFVSLCIKKVQVIQEAESHQSPEALWHLCKMFWFLSVRFLCSRLDDLQSLQSLISTWLLLFHRIYSFCEQVLSRSGWRALKLTKFHWGSIKLCVSAGFLRPVSGSWLQSEGLEAWEKRVQNWVRITWKKTFLTAVFFRKRSSAGVNDRRYYSIND